jgi:hypothetical protein
MKIPAVVLEWLELQRQKTFERHLALKDNDHPDAQRESEALHAKFYAYSDVYEKLKELA